MVPELSSGVLPQEQGEDKCETKESCFEEEKCVILKEVKKIFRQILNSWV